MIQLWRSFKAAREVIKAAEVWAMESNADQDSRNALLDAVAALWAIRGIQK